MIRFKVNKATFLEVRNNVDAMLEQVVRRAMKDSLMKAATPALKDARRKVLKRYGFLKKSLVKKGKTYRPKGMAYVIVGPNRRAGGEVDGKKVSPVKYAHLVEFGHRKKGGGMVAPNPFLRPAFEANKAEMKAIYTREIVPAVERQAANAARRQKRRR